MAQSGLAHLNGVQGVAGSNPALPTILRLAEKNFIEAGFRMAGHKRVIRRKDGRV